MFILTTIDNNYPAIWERGGVATFSSRYENHIVKDIKVRSNGILYAIGVYRRYTSEAQKFTPSVLIIKPPEIIDCRDHDIKIPFMFQKKMSSETDLLLRRLKKSPLPLTAWVEDSVFFMAINVKQEDFIQSLRQQAT